MVYKSGQIFLLFCHNTRLWQTDRQTDRRTDRQTEFSSLDRVCIACSAVKRQISTNQGAKHLQRFWWNLAWLTTFGTPPHMTTLVGVAHCRWSGQICDLSNLKCFCCLFYFFAFLTRSHFLTDCGDLYAKTHVFGQQCAFWRSWQYLTFRGSNPTKTSPKLEGIGIFKHKWQKEKSTYLKNWLTDWHKIICTFSDHIWGFVGGLVIMNYKSKIKADAIPY